MKAPAIRTWTGALRALLAEHWIVLVLAGVACGLSFVVRHEIFPAYSWNRDEPAYLWQTRMLHDGQLSGTDGGSAAFFQPWLAAARNGRVFSQYTPGFPLALLAADVLFGTPGVALAFSAGLAVVGTYAFARTIIGDRTIALVAAAAMTASPLLVIQSGLYLGYLFSLGVGLCFGALVLTGLDRRTGRLVTAGLLLGVIFLTRPFDTPLWALPIGVCALVRTPRREWRSLLRPFAWVGAGFAPLLVAGLLFNRHLTGSLTEFPITIADPLDKLGFGVRRIMQLWTPVDFTVWRAFRGTGRNLFFLPEFLFGSYVGLGVAGYALWTRRRDRSARCLVALAASFPIGYFFFWGIYLSAAKVTLTGPIYFVPLYAPLSILLAAGIVTVWRRRPRACLALTGVLVVATVPFLAEKLDRNRSFSDAQAPWRTSVGALKGKALVFVDRSGPYLLHLNPFSANDPDLGGRILYATDRGGVDLDLIAARPDRTPYLQSSDRYSRDSTAPPAVPVVTVRHVRVTRGSRLEVAARMTNRAGQPVVVAYARIGDHIVARRVLDARSRRNARYEAAWTLARAGDAGAGTLALSGRVGDISFGVGTGHSTASALRSGVEQQVSYRITQDGTIELMTPGRGIRVEVTSSRTVYHRTDATDAIRLRVRASSAASTS